MSLNVCPICKSITEQDILSTYSSQQDSNSGVEPELHVCVCRQCNTEIEHEVVLMNSIAGQGHQGTYVAV